MANVYAVQWRETENVLCIVEYIDGDTITERSLPMTLGQTKNAMYNINVNFGEFYTDYRNRKYRLTRADGKENSRIENFGVIIKCEEKEVVIEKWCNVLPTPFKSADGQLWARCFTYGHRSISSRSQGFNIFVNLKTGERIDYDCDLFLDMQSPDYKLYYGYVRGYAGAGDEHYL